MIKYIVNSFDYLNKLKYNVKLVPVSINYDFIFDQEYLSTQTLTGSIDPNTTLADIMKKILTVKWEKLGRCIVKFCKPIDLN